MSTDKKPQKEPAQEVLQNILKLAFDIKMSAAQHLLDDEELLLRWSTNHVSEEEREDVITHLARCSACRQGVAEMVKSGILDFGDSASKQPNTLLAVPTRKLFSYTTWIVGVLMTSAACILVCLLFLQENHDGQQFARKVEPQHTAPQPSDPSIKLRGGSRSLSSEPEKFALLVGINQYGNLPKNEWLDGCRNDIAEMKAVITERFGFAADNVTELLDDQATAASVRAQFSKLVESIQARPQDAPPAQVLFYFSGHGSRVPDQPEGHPDCDSPDGLDSTLVVYDSAQQGSDTDIRDDELNHFAHAICKDGKAELLICLDSCHSGGGARGITKFRGIDRNLERVTVTDTTNRQITQKTLPNGTVFFSACQSNQKEPEYEQDGKKFGLFTYHLTKLLRTEQIVSSLDYATLKDAIHRSYLRNKIAQAPTPTVEGNPLVLQRPVFGADRSIDRKPYWSVARQENDPGTVRMEAGKINDITPESLFELYESVEQAIDPNATSLGWFAINQVEGNYSLGSFFQWNKDRTDRIDTVLPNDFKNGFAVVRYHHYGDNVLAVRLVDAATDKVIAPQSTEIPEPIQAALSGLGTKNESNWIHWVGANDNCDVVIRFDSKSKYAAIFPALGRAEDNQADDQAATKSRGTTLPESLYGGWGPFEWGTEKGKTDMLDMLRRVMKGLSLKRLVAEKLTPVKTRGGEDKPTIEINVLRRMGEDRFDPVTPDSQKGIVLNGGEDDWYRLQIKNHYAKPFYVTILCIDPNMQIASFSCGPEANPEQFNPVVGSNNNSALNKLNSGSEFVSDFGFEPPFGLHSLIVLATREPGDFSYLAQEGLTNVGNAKGRGGADSVLDFLNDQCTLGTRATRPKPPPRDDAWSVGSVDAVVEPGK